MPVRSPASSDRTLRQVGGGRARRTLAVLVVAFVASLVGVGSGAQAATTAAGPRISPGRPVHTTITTPGTTKRYAFSGTTGQRATFAIRDADWSSPTDQYAGASLVLFDPAGREVGPIASVDHGIAFGEWLLDATGDWTVAVTPDHDTTGSQTTTLGLFRDQRHDLTLGQSTTLTVDQPGQEATYVFSASQGQRVTIARRPGRFSSPYQPEVTGVDVVLQRPDGEQQQVLRPPVGSPDGTFVASDPLPVSGRWSVRLVPPTGATGTQVFTVRLTRDQNHALTVGQPLTTSIGQAGQQAVYTFHAEKGQTLSAAVGADSTWSTPDGKGGRVSDYADVYLYRPPGNYQPETALFGEVVESSAGYATGGSPDRGALDVTGTWSLVVVPHLNTTGSMHWVVHLDDLSS